MKEARAVRLGVVGGGTVSQVAHLAHYAELPGCRIEALAEHRAGLRERVAAKFGIAARYPDHREMLERAELDAVVVAVQRARVGAVALDCLTAGLPVLTEKPMCGTSEEARKLVGAAETRKLPYAVGYMKRHDAGVQRAKAALDELTASGELGKIVSVRARCFGGDAWHGIPDYLTSDEPRTSGSERAVHAPGWVPGGRSAQYDLFLNTYCHDLNLLRFLLGRDPEVSSADLSGAGQIVRFDYGDFPGTLETKVSEGVRWDESVEIEFARGTLAVRLPAPFDRQGVATAELTGGRAPRPLPAAGAWAFRRQAESFLSNVVDRSEPLASGADSARDVILTERIWSVELGRRVEP